MAREFVAMGPWTWAVRVWEQAVSGTGARPGRASRAAGPLSSTSQVIKIQNTSASRLYPNPSDVLTWLRQEAQRKKMILVVVFLALFLDNMLLSVVVPILPSYLYEIGKAPATTPGNGSGLTVNPPINQSLNRRSVTLGSTAVPPHQTPALSSNLTAAQNPESNCDNADAHLDEVNVKVGLMLASKSTIQLLMNPFMGPLTESFAWLLLARSVQGVGGSCLSVAGMGMLADAYKDRQERGRAMGTSFTGLALGLIAGAPFGSLMYEFVGKMSPFLVLAAIGVLAGGTETRRTWSSEASLWRRPSSQIVSLSQVYTPLSFNHRGFKQRYGAICLTTMAVATIETTLPLRMMKTMCASKWQLGTVDSSIMPLMGNLVDLRYLPVYGTVYAIADVAVCIGFSVGPAIAGPIVKTIGFHRLMAMIGAANIIFSPLCIFLFTPTWAGGDIVHAHVSLGKTRNPHGSSGLSPMNFMEWLGLKVLIGRLGLTVLIGRPTVGYEQELHFNQINSTSNNVEVTWVSCVNQPAVNNAMTQKPEVINAALDEFFPPDSGVQVIAEPGRYFVKSAFTLAANVIGKKVVESSEQRFRSVLWGPTCDSTDKVTDSCRFPELDVGDWLLVDDMGAYSVIWCTDFNGFERAHIYPVVTAETWHTLNLSHIYNMRHSISWRAEEREAVRRHKASYQAEPRRFGGKAAWTASNMSQGSMFTGITIPLLERFFMKTLTLCPWWITAASHEQIRELESRGPSPSPGVFKDAKSRGPSPSPGVFKDAKSRGPSPSLGTHGAKY
ncbi:Synaptic vesicular amine transporter [Liparis tanakae]|uniref:Synaptic vesicular amine transporter n=1 Tax=Liparis tanakae TaxID=230148 RepID=A0A4Z2F6Y3_9TELE|nr:Synaptic vesicular amine transporter [Liparis tanakae]